MNDTQGVRRGTCRATEFDPYLPFVRDTLAPTLPASPTIVRLVAGTDEIARHVRSHDTSDIIEQEAHVAGLVAATRQDNPSSARDGLRLPCPRRLPCLSAVAARGESLTLDYDETASGRSSSANAGAGPAGADKRELLTIAGRAILATKDLKESEHALTRADPGEPRLSLREAYSLLGQVYLQLRRLDDARREFESRRRSARL